jgi:two-component system, OmpR family, phosphate regulon sensor histidine kinase PhoR
MLRHITGRFAFTLATFALTTAVVALLLSVVRDSLSDSYRSAIPDTIGAAWTVGVMLIGFATLAAWFLSGSMLRPVGELRRNLTLAARNRAIAEPDDIEVQELRSLRTTLAGVLQELDQLRLSAEVEQRRLLGLFEAISEGVLQVGPDARIVHVNEAARKLLRLPRQPAGQSISSLIRNVELREILEHASAGRHASPTEVLLDNRHLLIATRPLAAAQDSNTGAVVIVVDLTELRKVESVRKDFVANVSHELKTPLTSIRGYAETLISDDVPRATQLQFLEIIQNNADRLHNIVEELLDLSRLQSGGWQPQMQKVEAAALATEVWSTCAQHAGQKNIAFAVSGGPAYVEADPAGLRQVLVNLYENAIRYTAAAGRVDVVINQDNELVNIEVRDNGPGIPADALPRIFERFYRVDSARSREAGGTGLGLSIVKHLVESMAGQVSADSELGKGTVVRISLHAASAS